MWGLCRPTSAGELIAPADDGKARPCFRLYSCIRNVRRMAAACNSAASKTLSCSPNLAMWMCCSDAHTARLARHNGSRERTGMVFQPGGHAHTRTPLIFLAADVEQIILCCNGQIQNQNASLFYGNPRERWTSRILLKLLLFGGRQAPHSRDDNKPTLSPPSNLRYATCAAPLPNVASH